MILHLWGAEAATPMHSLHLGFGIGGIVAPQLANYFVQSTGVSEPNMYNGTTYFTADTLLNSTVTMNSSLTNTIPQLMYPYSIIGVSTFLCGLLMLLFTCYGTPKGYPKRQGTKQICNCSKSLSLSLMIIPRWFMYFSLMHFQYMSY